MKELGISLEKCRMSREKYSDNCDVFFVHLENENLDQIWNFNKNNFNFKFQLVKVEDIEGE